MTLLLVAVLGRWVTIGGNQILRSCRPLRALCTRVGNLAMGGAMAARGRSFATYSP